MTKMDPQERYVRGLQHALRTLDNNADDLGWIERDMARDAVSKALAAVQCDGRGAPSGQSGLDEDEQWTLDRAGDLLEHYADYIKTVKPDDIECHPYLPELEQVSADLRAFTKRLSGGGSHYVGAACPQGASSRLEAPLADARFQRPDAPDTCELLRQAAEALEDAKELLLDYSPRSRTAKKCDLVAAALRQRAGRE